MEITNELVGESFSCVTMGKNISSRMNELELLDDIVDYCGELGEKVFYENDIWSIEVEDGVTLDEYIFGTQGASADCKAFVAELISKKCKAKRANCENIIHCSCGSYAGAASDLLQYAKKRQEYLKTLKKYEEYRKFMRSCFPHSIFSEDCDTEFAHIKDFEANVDEITECLSVLDEIAVKVYVENHDNIAEAMKIIEAKIGRKCSPDPKHKSELKFKFRYEEYINGEVAAKLKEIECQPHLKLIRKDSDLRIYFYWKDDEVGNGEKVLIGRVGRHGWNKKR